MKSLLYLLPVSPPSNDTPISKGEVLYEWETPSGKVWKGFGEKETQTYYEGEVENGKPHGLGTLREPNGEKYVGEWKEGKQHGQGTLTKLEKSSSFFRFWKNKKSDVTKYEGEWKDGKRHGQGTLTFPDGRKYEGEWREGVKHGQGTYTFPDGGQYVGEWKESEKWNITEYDKNGNITGRFVNGVWKSN